MNRFTNNLLWITLACSLLLLEGCGSSAGVVDGQRAVYDSISVDALLESAERSTGVQAAEFLLLAVEELLQGEEMAQAAAVIADLDQVASLPTTLQFRYAIAQAEIANQQLRYDEALSWLQGNFVGNPGEHSPALQARFYHALASASLATDEVTQAIDAYLGLSALGPDYRTQNLHDALWSALVQLDQPQLDSLANSASTYELRGWVELARVLRLGQFNVKGQLDAVAQWRRIWSQHTARELLPTALADLQRIWDQRPTRLALLLPLQTPAGNAIQEGFVSAYYQALSVSSDVPQIAVFDTSNTREIAPLYNAAVASGAELIIGPLDKVLVNQLREMQSLPVPTLALNYADVPAPSPTNLFQFGLAPEDEMEQAAQLAWEAGYRQAAIITPQTEDYLRLRDSFAEIWRNKGGLLVSEASFTGDSDYGRIVKKLMAIDASEDRAARLLALLPRNNMEFIPRRRQDIDFIFLIANPRQGRQLKPTLAFYFAEDIPVFALPAIYDGQQNQSANRDLDGIVFTDAPWVLNSADPLKAELMANLRQVQGPLQRLRAMGVDSFRLYPVLQQLSTGELEWVQGTTGSLSMNPNRRIRRTLDVAKFVNGIASPYTVPPSASD